MKELNLLLLYPNLSFRLPTMPLNVWQLCSICSGLTQSYGPSQEHSSSLPSLAQGCLLQGQELSQFWEIWVCWGHCPDPAGLIWKVLTCLNYVSTKSLEARNNTVQCESVVYLTVPFSFQCLLSLVDHSRWFFTTCSTSNVQIGCSIT